MTTPLVTRILFATDFSDDAGWAQEYARYLATMWNATLDVIHVIEGPHWSSAEAEMFAATAQARAQAARQLDQVRDDLARDGVAAKARLVLGNPTEHICLAAKDTGVELLVLGLQGQTNLLHGLIGSTTEWLVKEGPCPVFAVPGQREGTGGTSSASGRLIRHVLAPLDFSSPSLDAVEYAIHLAKGLGAALTLMHVLEPVGYDLDCGLGLIEEETRKRDYWNRQLMDLRDVITSFGLPTDLEISGGLPSDAILACALRRHSDLIVMGTHGRREVSEAQFGSVAQAVLRRATCPIVTVKTHTFAEGHRRVLPSAMRETDSKGVEL